jgi:hypothetical protein
LVSCTDIDHPSPALRTLARFDGREVAPLTICDALFAFANHPGLGFRVVGTGFVSEVRGATSDIPNVNAPTVDLTGPQGITLVPAQAVRSAERIDVTLPATTAVDPAHLPDGAYSVTVVDPDGSSAHLANALVIQPPPQVTSVSPTATCANAPTTVVLRPGPFSPDVVVNVATTTIFPASSVHYDAPDQITVVVPAGAGAGMPRIELIVDDPNGCSTRFGIQQACP